jgi:hypothetical protein
MNIRAIGVFTLFARSEAGIVGSNLTQGMDVWCAFFCVCVQLEALRRVDHPSKESKGKKRAIGGHPILVIV